MHLNFVRKFVFFEILQNNVISHIYTAIRHILRVANGLDNAGLCRHTKVVAKIVS
jgi:hypothetical protein